MCFQKYIGIRGVCQDGYSIYLDSLPGISLKKSALIAEKGTAKELIEDISENAVSCVERDFKSILSEMGYNFKSIVGQVEKTSSGSDTWMIGEDKFYSIRVDRHKNKKGLYSYIADIGLTVKCDAKKTFYLYDSGVTTEKEVILKKGYNKISLDFKARDCNTRIYFNPLGLEIGKKVSSSCCTTGCIADKCCSIHFEESEDGCNWSGCPEFGIDICAYCKCDFPICDFKEELEGAILYKAGILWAYEVLTTDRDNSFSRNSKENIRELLLRWEGGESKITLSRFKGKYYKALESAAIQVPKEKFICEHTVIVGGLK